MGIERECVCRSEEHVEGNAKEAEMDIEECATIIVDAAIKVHRSLGPGLLESAYQACLAHELRKRGLRVECEVGLPIAYDGQVIEVGYRVDMWIERLIMIENKAVDRVLPIYGAQLLTYMKLRDCHLGLLNWNVLLMKNGITRVVNNLEGPGFPCTSARHAGGEQKKRPMPPSRPWRPSR